MISASYEYTECPLCSGHRYLNGGYEFTLDIWGVKRTWHNAKDRVITSMYLQAHSGNCPGCFTVARAHCLVILQLLYKLRIEI